MRPVLSIAALLLASFLQPSFACAAEEEGFVPLFNGHSLDGWRQHGGQAKYSVEEGEIVGTSVLNTPNSFLCTQKEYANFILEVDVLDDPQLNSGIQIRSRVFESPRTYHFQDREGQPRSVTVPEGRVHGYQVEIDPSERAWSGGIYDEGRRGWLFDLKGDEHAAARKAFRQGDWNHFRVEAVGPSIKTWVNGVPAADLTDEMTLSGFIALQVHGIGDNESKVGRQIRWKNIRIKELPRTAARRDDALWLEFAGTAGPGLGKRVVLISGDEEYRSEEALTQLAKILAERHGFTCTVLFAIDPATGAIRPDIVTNIPGLEKLDNADLAVIFVRRRSLSDNQMESLDRYLKSGKPVLGIRTATHAFLFPAGSRWVHYSDAYQGEPAAWQDGFGRLVLGEKWHTHHGKHKHQSTRGRIAPDQKDHPVLRGIADGAIWGPTDVYGVRLPLPGDAQPLVLGEVVDRAGPFDENDRFYGMRETDTHPASGPQNEPRMPIVWTKSFQLPDGVTGQSLTSTIGSSTDLLNEGVRRVLVNGVYYLTGLADQIPLEGTAVGLMGDYQPTRFEFRSPEYWAERRLKPADLR